MSKRKNRAGRKQQRERAVRAEERGLPKAQWEEAGQAERVHRALRQAARESARGAGGRPMWLVVLGGALAILIVVFLLSKSRKQELLAPPPDEGSAPATPTLPERGVDPNVTDSQFDNDEEPPPTPPPAP